MKSSRFISRMSCAALFAVITLLSLPLNTNLRSSSAEACWTNLRIECFDSTRAAWPWCLPQGQGRCWRISPALPQLTWGIQERNYSIRLQSLCGDDDNQSIWIIGGPGTEDPDFDDYPANLNTYVSYGPINTTNAQEAHVQFSLLMYNGMDIQDTICWGADSVFTLATSHIWIDSVFSGQTEAGWQTFTMDLKDLYRNIPTRDSVSALGRPQVFVYWWFRSDADAIRDVGAFIDDVIVATDDGTIDMLAGGMGVTELDSVTIPTRIEVGDYVRARVTWAVCDGGVLFYPDFHVGIVLDNDIVVFDTLMTDVQPGQSFTWYTDSILMTAAGEHNFVFSVDPWGEAEESNENNNTAEYPFTVFAQNVPPTFDWIEPSLDTLRSLGQVTLRWQLFDPDDEATVTIRVDNDAEGCVGPIVPGALNRPETDGPDSAIWSTVSLPVGAIRWPFAEYADALFWDCEYAPFPVQVVSLDAGGRPVFKPLLFAMMQNYPNPFNPETKIEFGITQAGHTTLKVFDITGREVTTLIDNDLTPGYYEANFNAGFGLPSGVYLYRLDAPEGSMTKKMILMK